MTGSPDRCDLLCFELPRAEAVRARQWDVGALSAAAERAKAVADTTRLSVATALASRRDGKMVMHRLTGVGEAMLAAVLPAQVRA